MKEEIETITLMIAHKGVTPPLTPCTKNTTFAFYCKLEILLSLLTDWARQHCSHEL